MLTFRPVCVQFGSFLSEKKENHLNIKRYLMRSKQSFLYYEQLIEKAFSIKKIYNVRGDDTIEIQKITGLDMIY